MKDLGWMTTNVYLGWSFGILAVILHLIMLIVDWKYSIPFRFYHISLLLWIIGNFLWMCVEFMLNKESSAIHFGPHTPLGGMSVEMGHILTSFKSYLFLTAIFIQFLLYFCINRGYIEMPIDESEKIYGYSLTDGSFHSENNSNDNFNNNSNHNQNQNHNQNHNDNESITNDTHHEFHENNNLSNHNNINDNHSKSLSNNNSNNNLQNIINNINNKNNNSNYRIVDIDEEKEIEIADIFPSHRYPMGFSLTFIENCYIVLWISKDYFWSWATGDFKINHLAGIFTEIVSMLFGFLSVSLFGYVTYCWRHNFVNMMDSLTSFCWLSANFIWMGGEVFIRYGSLQLDDFDQADDEIARLFSGLFFLLGLQIQVIVIFHEVVTSIKAQQREQEMNSSLLLEIIATPTDSRDISIPIHVNN